MANDDPNIPKDLTRQIEEIAGGPLSARGDSGSVQQHSLPDMIAADQYLANKRAAQSRSTGFRRVQLIPPGTSSYGRRFRDLFRFW